MINPEPIDPDLTPMFRPLAELEASAPGALIIEFLATRPEARGKGVGAALIDSARSQAGSGGVALVVSDNNMAARGLYEKAGRSLLSGVERSGRNASFSGRATVAQIKRRKQVDQGTAHPDERRIAQAPTGVGHQFRACHQGQDEALVMADEITSPLGDRMGAVACWNAVMDENQCMVRKWNEFTAA